MQFKQPEVLYALLFLIIPLLVHLFQLRKFQKEEFTNVKFLKRIARQTRKSSRLKKWLVLISRMLTLAAMVIAFAQPFFPAAEANRNFSQKIIYLDNSLSMQAPGKNGRLMQSAIQDLMESLPENENFHLLTNDAEFRDVTSKILKNRLQDIDFSQKTLNFDEIKLKSQQLGKNNEAELILISDFPEADFPKDFSGNGQIKLIPKVPVDYFNLNLDTLYIKKQNPEEIEIQFEILANKNSKEPVSISVFNGEELLGRKSPEPLENNKITGSFRLPNNPIANGRLEIEDNGLQYDNSLFFSINSTQKINAVVISAPETDAGFLSRIYTEPEFDFSSFTIENLDFNHLANADLVVLNELNSIPKNMISSLQEIHKNSGIIVVIPPVKNQNLNTFLQSVGNSGYGNSHTTEKLITNIAFGHPLMQGVFEESVYNFDYPLSRSSYTTKEESKVLEFQDQSAFLTFQNGVAVFASALNPENSNFKNSPLVVPVFYNLGREALTAPKLYYEIGKENQIEFPLQSNGDEIINLTSEEENFIPQQQAFAGKIQLNTNNLPKYDGNFNLIFKDETRGSLSYNFNRKESKTQLHSPKEFENANVYYSVKNYFTEVRKATKETALWKSFVILALIFLILEMLLLKFFK